MRGPEDEIPAAVEEEPVQQPEESLHSDAVLVGAEDFVQRQISRTLAELDDSEPDFGRACDLVRIYIGTLLKTDQVSLLLGSGCSRHAGGVLLGTVPYEVERGLLMRGIDKDGTPESWLHLFYRTTQYFGDAVQRDPLQRLEQVNQIEECRTADPTRAEELLKAFPIATNYEELLSRLHTWSASLGADYLAVGVPLGEDVIVNRADLGTLIQELTIGLAEACTLRPDYDDANLRYHRLLVQRLLTRPINLRRVDLFTLNYDTLLEQAMDSCGIVTVDGFVGSLRRVFRPESYDHDLYFPGDTTEGRVHRLDRVMHLYKLHGSVSWRTEKPGWHNPYGLYATFHEDADNHDVLIYPTPLKYGEVLGMPYSEMFRRFASSIVRPQSVLFVMGYGFRDAHVNAIIRQALAIPSFTLVVVDPAPKNPFLTQLIEQKDKRVCVIKGGRLGTFSGFVEQLLPDLDEEKILQDVLKTYKALDPGQLRDSAPVTGENNGE